MIITVLYKVSVLFKFELILIIVKKGVAVLSWGVILFVR